MCLVSSSARCSSFVIASFLFLFAACFSCSYPIEASPCCPVILCIVAFSSRSTGLYCGLSLNYHRLEGYILYRFQWGQLICPPQCKWGCIVEAYSFDHPGNVAADAHAHLESAGKNAVNSFATFNFSAMHASPYLSHGQLEWRSLTHVSHMPSHLTNMLNNARN